MNRIWMSTCQLFDIYAMHILYPSFLFLLSIFFFQIFFFLYFVIFLLATSYYLPETGLRTNALDICEKFIQVAYFDIHLNMKSVFHNKHNQNDGQMKNEQRFSSVQPKKSHKRQINNEWRWIFEFMMLFLFCILFFLF